MFEGLRDLVLATNLALQGVPATITRPAPDDAPIDTRILWLDSLFVEAPVGAEFTRQTARRVMVLSRTAVETVPLKTAVQAPERPGLSPVGWVVDGYAGLHADHHRVYVVPGEA